MKRFLSGGSCLALLVIAGLCVLIGLFFISILVQQLQATTLNNTATSAAHFTPTVRRFPSTTLVPNLDSTSVPTDSEVTIHIETSMPDTEISVPVISPSAAPLLVTAMSTPTPLPVLQSMTPLALPPKFGTSSYPLTVTAEVMLGQTSVAHYLSNVDASRTAVAAESVSIYATLTAAASAGGQ